MPNNLENVYEKCLKFADDLCGRHNVLEVAAVMAAISLSIYKTALSEEDFAKIMESIFKSKDNIKTFDKPTIQ